MSSISRTNGGASGDLSIDDDSDPPPIDDPPAADQPVDATADGDPDFGFGGDGIDAGAAGADDPLGLSFDPGGEPGPEPITIDQLLLAFNDAPTDSPDGPSGARRAATDANGATTLGDAEIERQRAVTRRPMDDISAYVPKNNPEKQQVLGNLFAADKALDAAKANVQDATAKRDQAHAKLDVNPGSVAQQKAATKADQAAIAAETAVTKAEANVAKAEAALVKLMKKQSPGKDAEIDAVDISARKETQTTYDVKVGGQDIHLVDDIQSYATTHKLGLTLVGKSEPVAPVVDASNLGASAKTILKATSKSEGDFSSINGYDRMNLSFGYIQFAGGGGGNLLPEVLQKFKSEDPAGFADSLAQFGIDVGRDSKGRSELICKDHEGNELRGDAAAKSIGSDPQLAAALAASGTRMPMKTAQVEVSANILTDARNHTVPHTQVKVSDVITSEYGNGLLYDRSVNLGSGGTASAFDDIARSYLALHPGADLTADPARADVEAKFIAWAERQAPGRATTISQATNHDAGSFLP